MIAAPEIVVPEIVAPEVLRFLFGRCSDYSSGGAEYWNNGTGGRPNIRRVECLGLRLVGAKTSTRASYSKVR